MIKYEVNNSSIDGILSFIKNGEIVFHKDVDVIREEKNMSIDSLFREVFAC